MKGHAVDHRSDIFATGVLLWEMLCGQKLFTGDSDIAVLEKVRAAEVAPPRTLNPSIPEGLEEVVLLKQPHVNQDKYGGKTIDELRAELSAKTGENVVIKRFTRFAIGA